MNHYKTVILRNPSQHAALGLTTVDQGEPDIVLLKQQHQYYRQTMESLNLEVIMLEYLLEYPDSYFVEDVAVITPETAVLTCPGAEQRRGETKHMELVLREFREIERIEEPGTLDGGDVLVVGKHCIIGISARTNWAGARQLAAILRKYGYYSDIIRVRQALHLKSSVNFLDDNTLLVTQTSFWLDCLAGYRKFVTPEGEEYAANVVWVNGKILIPDNFDGTCRLLEYAGFEVTSIPVSEIQKMDGGLTCLSLRLH